MLVERRYNRANALEYARLWAFSRNPLFYNYTGQGGDCTNFVSQCLFVGAGVMNFDYPFGWFYSSPWERSPSWSGVEYLWEFLVDNDSVGPYGREMPIWQLSSGDVIQLGDGERFYHSLFVIETEPEITIAAHTDDAYNRALMSYSYTVARGFHIEGVRVP